MTAHDMPLDVSIAQVQRLRSESRSTVKKKIKRGAYESYLSGRRRMVVLASVFADREREMLASAPSKSRAENGKFTGKNFSPK